ncbi:MAG: hypothetical protein RLZZ344_613 [Pseudomonadota bacterium]
MTPVAALAPDRWGDPIVRRLPAAVSLYCVGGAVRDALLGLPSKDRDYLVVGATPAVMVEAGFRPVGQDFPVFLHPETQAEYALARTERKSGMGYKGFVFHASPEVGLEEDLIRRDITINAMAVDSAGVLHDPFNGQADLAGRRLRHVSPAFIEDPVRLLRLARFLARWAGFRVDAETTQLCAAMVRAGEVNALVPERVWQELWRGLEAAAPAAMVNFLCELGCYETITGTTPPDAEQRSQLDALRAAEIPPALLAAWLWGAQPQPPRLPLPREVSQWAGLLHRNGHRPPLQRPIDHWPGVLVDWAESWDLFRQPDRLGPLMRLVGVVSSPLTEASATGTTPSGGHAAELLTQWEAVAHALIHYPVGTHAQAAARAHQPVAEAVHAAREAFVAHQLGLTAHGWPRGQETTGPSPHPTKGSVN